MSPQPILGRSGNRWRHFRGLAENSFFGKRNSFQLSVEVRQIGTRGPLVSKISVDDFIQPISVRKIVSRERIGDTVARSRCPIWSGYSLIPLVKTVSRRGHKNFKFFEPKNFKFLESCSKSNFSLVKKMMFFGCKMLIFSKICLFFNNFFFHPPL